MSRVQLALNVSDLSQAIDFYSKLFNTSPAKVREGYANFAVENPPLKLVLIEGGGQPGTLNHLGVEVETPELVQNAITHLQSSGLATDIEEETTCCFAVQDKVWVNAPDGEPWEVYTVLADADSMTNASATNDSACCSTEATQPVTLSPKACC